jgi:hypothetical protein
MVWGYMDDIGLTQIHTLRTSMGQNLLGQILDPGYQIGGAGLLAGSYRIGVETNPSGNANSCPTAAPLGPYFTDWASSKSSQLATTVSAMQTQWNNEKTDAEFGYPNILRAAASYMNTMTGNYNGATAWNWVIANADDPALNSNPKWALVPRGTSTTPPPPAPPVPPPPTTPGKKITACDLDGDGQLTPADVSVAVQQVLNPASCKTADLNKDGVCNIVDVQLLINAVNAGSCPY